MRCYKCQGYNHRAQICKNETGCGENGHTERECNNKKITCNNYSTVNYEINFGFNTNHTAYDKFCTVDKRILQQARSRIDYHEK